MAYHRILTIQDISCVGQCSMTVALPILSACGQETCVLPTAVLSTHTGGFGQVEICNLSHAITPFFDHWQRQGVFFDAVYTGYLGKTEDISKVLGIVKCQKERGGTVIVDPAMADHGRMYLGLDAEYAQTMGELCMAADIMIPNITEACLMTGTPYEQSYDEAWIRQLVTDLSQKSKGLVILTGVSYEPEQTGVVICKDGEMSYYAHKKIPQSYHGTGDIFASAFTGCYMNGKTVQEAVQIAADFTALCIKKTYDDPAHWYGVKFETALGALISMLEQK